MALLVVDQRIEILLHGICVELFSIGKSHALTDFKGVGAAIRRNRPAFCYGGMIASVISEGNQPFEKHFLGEHFAAIEMRVQIAEIAIV